MASFTVQEIARCVNGELSGPGDLVIREIDQLDRAGPEHLTFIRDAKHAGDWAGRKAGAALVTRGVTIEEVPGRAIIRVPDADMALAQVLELFAPPPPRPTPGIHASAYVDPTASIGEGVAIGPGVYIGPGVKIGAGCIIHANASILDLAVLGPRCEIFCGVVISHRCELGAQCVIHANAVIGGDGFGYRPAPDGRGMTKIPHIGIVRIGNQVEIGACTCIDRAKFSATVIGDGTKLDNLCHIAHNVIIGRACAIAGQVGIAGSATLGDGILIGGGTVIRDHVTIGSGVRIAGASAVVTDIPAGESWAGYPAQDARIALRESAALRRLPDLLRSMREPPKK